MSGAVNACEVSGCTNRRHGRIRPFSQPRGEYLVDAQLKERKTWPQSQH